MKTYITATETASFEAFKTSSKDRVSIIECSSLPAAVHVFYLATGTTTYRDVTLSTKKPTLDNNLLDVDVMNSDEFLLNNI